MESGGHRRIELQSPEDLTYLIQNVRDAATTSIRAAFPDVNPTSTTTSTTSTTTPSDDDLHSRIEHLVHAFITQTFTLAAPNLCINGLDVGPHQIPALSNPSATSRSINGHENGNGNEIEERFEPFDARKRQQVEDLTREAEELFASIAALKRQVPSAVASAYAENFKEGVRLDDEGLRREKDSISAGVTKAFDGGEAGEKRVLLSKPTLERQADVEATFGHALGTLGALKRDMPSTVAKMERARVAGEYVVMER